MKICLLCTSYPRSKDDYWVPFMHSLAKELAKTEDITIVTSGDPNTKNFEVRDNVKIHFFTYFYPKKFQKLTYTGGMREKLKSNKLAKLQLPFFIIFFFLKALSKSKDCDIINAHWTLSALVGIFVRKFRKKPVVLTIHGGGVRASPKWLTKYIVKRVDAITTAHNDMKDIIESYGVKVNLIRNMIDFEKYKKVKKGKIKKEFNLGGDKIITFIGRLENMKDPITFVKAIPYVLKKRKDVKFLIIGDGYLKEEVKGLIKKLKVKKNAIFVGPRSDVANFLIDSDLFTAISPEENCFSTTIIEAMTLKRPCIITKVGYTKRFFKHKKNCYLINYKKERELAHAILVLLKDNKLVNEIIKGGDEFLIKNGFTKEIVYRNMMKVFNEVVSKH